MAHIQYESRVDDPYGERVVRVDESRSWFSPGRVLGGIVGLVLTFVGAITLFKTGVGSDLTTPMASVFGMAQSPLVGLVEIAAGLLLLLFAASEDGRAFIGLIGVLAIIAGLVGTVASAQIKQDLGFDANAAWFVVVSGIVALVAAMIPSVFRSRRRVRAVDEPATYVR